MSAFGLKQTSHGPVTMSAYETQAALAASAQQAQQPFTHLRVLFLGAESQSTNHHFLASWPHAQFVRSGYHTQHVRARLFISAEKTSQFFTMPRVMRLQVCHGRGGNAVSS